MNYYKYKAFDLAFASKTKENKTQDEKNRISTFNRIQHIKKTFGLFMKNEYLNSKNKHIVDLNKLLHTDISHINFLKEYDVHLFEKDERSAIILGELSKKSPIIIYKKINSFYKILYFNFPDEDDSQILFFDNHERIMKKEVYDKNTLLNNVKEKNEFILEVLYSLDSILSENVNN